MNGKTEERIQCGQMVLNKQESALHLLVMGDENEKSRDDSKLHRLWCGQRTARKRLECDTADSNPRSGSQRFIADCITGGPTDGQPNGMLVIQSHFLLFMQISL